MKTKVIALSAGHGYYTAGKRCMKALDANQTREWFLNDRIMDLVEEQLKKYKCKVLRVDDTTGAKDIKRSSRVKSANSANADIYLSMHHNAGIHGGVGGGTVVFYYPADDCKAIATKLYQSIVGQTGLRGNRATPIANGKHLEVINSTKMPAFLVENGFMDSQADVPIILSKEHAGKTALGVVNFLIEHLGLEVWEAAEEERSIVYYPACYKKYVSIVVALNSIGVDGSFSHRAQIAKANHIAGYLGTAAQNIQMLNLLKAGLLKMA